MKKADFIGYEYLEITINKELEAIYTDSYPNFGWQLERTSPALQPNTTLSFKRNRKLPNKAELTRLQRKFNGIIADINSLEHSKRLIPATAAYLVGLIGSGFMAGSVFTFTNGNVPLTIILELLAFFGWVMPYFIYQRFTAKRSMHLSPIIEEKFDDLYALTYEANHLLA